MKRINELPFVDLYLNLDPSPRPARYRPKAALGDTKPLRPVPDEFSADVDVLRQKLATIKKRDFSLRMYDMRLRGSRQQSANGEIWCSLRSISRDIPTLESTGIKWHVLPLLRAVGRHSGLIIIAGATGQGKTTTANALLHHLLTTQGDGLITIEDPVEYDLTTLQTEDNFCFQWEVEEEQDWSEHIKTALRWHPRYIFLGEIRTPEAAAQTLRAANSGHLVITTMHAGSVDEALNGLLQIAGDVVGDRGPSLLAAGLLAVVHQTLMHDGPHLRTLFCEAGNLGDPARSAIRGGRLETLNSIVDLQDRRARITNTGSDEARLRALFR